MGLEFPTRAERPGKQPHAASLAAPWPDFMYDDPVMKRLFGRVIAEYSEFQFYVWDDERDDAHRGHRGRVGTVDRDGVPETGSYVVPGALVPVEIDRERNEGL